MEGVQSGKPPFYVFGSAGHRTSPPAYDHNHSAKSARRWRAGTARRCLCYVTPPRKNTLGLPSRRRAQGLIAYKIARPNPGPEPRPPPPGAPRPQTTETQAAPATLSTGTSSSDLSLDPGNAPAEYHDENPAGRTSTKKGRILPNVPAPSTADADQDTDEESGGFGKTC